MQKIRPCLWFDGNAEEAVELYTSIFPESKILQVKRFGKATAEASGQPAGSVMTIVFTLAGQEFMALNGGPAFKHTPAISLMVDCATQAEVDHFWDKLAEGGQTMECGWLTDRFGISWQIVPSVLGKVLGEGDTAGSERAMKAMLQMVKFDVEQLERAYRGE